MVPDIRREQLRRAARDPRGDLDPALRRRGGPAAAAASRVGRGPGRPAGRPGPPRPGRSRRLRQPAGVVDRPPAAATAGPADHRHRPNHRARPHGQAGSAEAHPSRRSGPWPGRGGRVGQPSRAAPGREGGRLAVDRQRPVPLGRCVAFEGHADGWVFDPVAAEITSPGRWPGGRWPPGSGLAGRCSSGADPGSARSRTAPPTTRRPAPGACCAACTVGAGAGRHRLDRDRAARLGQHQPRSGVRDGAAFDPGRTGGGRSRPGRPQPGRLAEPEHRLDRPRLVWSGRSRRQQRLPPGRHVTGLAYDPKADRWRRLPRRAPLRPGDRGRLDQARDPGRGLRHTGGHVRPRRERLAPAPGRSGQLLRRRYRTSPRAAGWPRAGLRQRPVGRGRRPVGQDRAQGAPGRRPDRRRRPGVPDRGAGHGSSGNGLVAYRPGP